MNDVVPAPWWRRHGVLIVYLAAAIIVTWQQHGAGHHGVYDLYRIAFDDLRAGRDLYATTNYRYSPTFALLFAPLAVLPLTAGLLVWCLLGFLGMYAAFEVLLRHLPPGRRRLAQLLILGEVVRCMQNTQSNALITALMIAAFLAYERAWPWRGAWAVTVGAAIKVFPAGAGLFALLRPRPARAILALAAAGAVLLAAPMLVTGPQLLLQQYHWWITEAPGPVRRFYSAMDLFGVWTGAAVPHLPVQLLGLALLLGPVFLRRGAWDAPAFRRLVLYGVLGFSLLFNPRAESPTFVVGMAGVVAWWADGPRERWRTVLLVLAVALVTGLRSDLVPRAWRNEWLDPLRIMTIPVLAAWAAMLADLARFDAARADA